MILLDEYRPIPAHPKLPSRSGVIKNRATSPHKNRVWNFLENPSGRMSSDALKVVGIASGSITFTYKIASGLREWPNRDPIEEEGGLNLYGYVENDPVNLVDPLGLTPCDDFVDNLVGLTSASPFMPQTSAGLALMGQARFHPDNANRNNPTGGFRPELVGTNRGQAYRHIMGVAGSRLLGTLGREVGKSQMGSDVRQLSDPNPSRALEAQSEVAANEAGKEVGQCLKDAFKNKTPQDELRDQLKKILCG